MKSSTKSMTQSDVVDLLKAIGVVPLHEPIGSTRKTRRATVTRITSRDRINITTCREAIYASMIELGGNARVIDVAKHVEKHYKHRPWKRSTIYNYCAQLSRPQVFNRVSRGVYDVIREVARKAA